MTKQPKDMMSKTVDSWTPNTAVVRRSNEAPQLTPSQVKQVEERIKNWGRRNF